MSPEELRDGFIQVMQDCYAADAYFERLDAQFIDENFKFTLHQLPYWKRHRAGLGEALHSSTMCGSAPCQAAVAVV